MLWTSSWTESSPDEECALAGEDVPDHRVRQPLRNGHLGCIRENTITTTGSNLEKQILLLYAFVLFLDMS